jgi:uncharacterized protein YkwD
MWYFRARIKNSDLGRGFLSAIPIVFLFIIFFIILGQNHPFNSFPLENIGFQLSSAYASQRPLLLGSTKEGIIRETNKARHHNGLPSLIENDLLNQLAAERINDMFQNQYFGHVSPSGDKYTKIALRLGYPYKRISENIAYMTLYSTDQKFVNMWMQSPGHRRNILDSDVKEIGVAVRKGYLKGNDTWVSVQIFGLQSPPECY